MRATREPRLDKIQIPDSGLLPVETYRDRYSKDREPPPRLPHDAANEAYIANISLSYGAQQQANILMYRDKYSRANGSSACGVASAPRRAIYEAVPRTMFLL